MVLNEIFMDAVTMDETARGLLGENAGPDVCQDWDSATPGPVGAYGAHISEPSIKQPSERSGTAA